MEIVKRCEQITLDYERSRFQPLSVKDRVQLRMHLGICKKCRHYLKDSQKIDVWLKRRFERLDETYHFSSDEKITLKKSLKH